MTNSAALVLCCDCRRAAVWHYAPADGIGSPRIWYCDDHVPRGCSCNWIEEEQREQLDERGRRLPCCEYDYEAAGFEAARYLAGRNE